ncbi:MAG: SIMPL domain-containing protein [Paracoccaceae bacterium]
MPLLRLLGIVLVVLATPVQAQQEQPRLRIEATGDVAVVPDMAAVSVGVETRAVTAEAALRQSSERMKRIFSLLQERGIALRDIQTTQFDLRPEWRDQTQSYDKPLVIVGFSVTNTVTVRIRTLKTLGPVLDHLTKAGANRIQSVRFLLAQPGPRYDEARKRAVKEAIRRAGLIAGAAGHKLGPILLIEEMNGASAPPLRAGAVQAMAAVPLAQGEMRLSVRVAVEFALD